MNGINAILVSVDYSDLLRLTLPYNRHHFSTVTIVTSNDDMKNVMPIAHRNQAAVIGTDAFYENGAHFNKWLALERALTITGLRNCGWLCIIDADILIPRTISIKLPNPREVYATKPEYSNYLRAGYLYSPLRHMYPAIPLNVSQLPPEELWKDYPIHRNTNEWAGYMQVFHTSDPALDLCGNCTLPREQHPVRGCSMFAWHQTNWKHAGGADSFFQLRWEIGNKIRPNFNVLHMGPSGINWAGRVTPYVDGSSPEKASERIATVHQYMQSRRATRPGEDRFRGELIQPHSSSSSPTIDPEQGEGTGNGPDSTPTARLEDKSTRPPT